LARPIASLETKLFKNALVTEGCWLWLGTKNALGYGIISNGRKGEKVRAHRACYELVHGKIPDGLVACHKCDNPSCVNPGHIFLGTKKENTADMWAKGRGFTPFKTMLERAHHNCKMLDVDVVTCRQMHETGNYTTKQLSQHFGVSQTHIRRVVKRQLRLGA